MSEPTDAEIADFKPDTAAHMDTGATIAKWHMGAIAEIAAVSGKYDESAVKGCFVALASRIMVELDACETEANRLAAQRLESRPSTSGQEISEAIEERALSEYERVFKSREIRNLGPGRHVRALRAALKVALCGQEISEEMVERICERVTAQINLGPSWAEMEEDSRALARRVIRAALEDAQKG